MESLMQVTVAVMNDSTVAVELAALQALLQWPYLSDLSLINAMASIFQRPATQPGASVNDSDLLYITAS